MGTRLPLYLTNLDSAPAMLRALSDCLNGQSFSALGQSHQPKSLAATINRLPAAMREKAFTRSSASAAVPPKKISKIDAESIAHRMVSQYPQRQYPGMAIGATNGALIHLCAALQIPWLPQTYLIPVRQRMDPDAPEQALAQGREAGQRLLQANPELQLHQVHDPSQSRLMAQQTAAFRVKRRCLGASYEAFLKNHLAPGGTLFLADCGRTWPTTRVDDRYVFQFGAIGGATEKEYFNGGPRVTDFLKRMGSAKQRWEPPPPDGESPEAEWGLEPALGEDVERFAQEQGYRVKRLVFREPERLSPLVADLYRWWYDQCGIMSNRLLAESYTLVEPWWAFRLGAVPFWMLSSMVPSADRLGSYLQGGKPYNHIHIALFPPGVESIGLRSIERWQSLLNRAHQESGFIGVDKQAYPSDFAAFARYHKDLLNILVRYPPPPPLPPDEFDRFLKQAGKRYSVSLQ